MCRTARLNRLVKEHSAALLAARFKVRVGPSPTDLDPRWIVEVEVDLRRGGFTCLGTGSRTTSAAAEPGAGRPRAGSRAAFTWVGEALMEERRSGVPRRSCRTRCARVPLDAGIQESRRCWICPGNHLDLVEDQTHVARSGRRSGAGSVAAGDAGGRQRVYDAVGVGVDELPMSRRRSARC